MVSESIKRWKEEATKNGATHLIVVWDSFDDRHYPVYVMKGEELKSKKVEIDSGAMQEIQEVVIIQQGVCADKYKMKYEIELTEKQKEFFEKLYPGNILGGIMRAIEEKTFFSAGGYVEEKPLYGYSKIFSKERKCGNCDFFGKNSDVCRLNPPMIIGIRSDYGEFTTTLPGVDENEWCGQFKPKIKRG